MTNRNRAFLFGIVVGGILVLALENTDIPYMRAICLGLLTVAAACFLIAEIRRPKAGTPS
jgi:fucose permease